MEGMGGKGREEGGGEEVGPPFNFLPPGATDLVTPLMRFQTFWCFDGGIRSNESPFNCLCIVCLVYF